MDKDLERLVNSDKSATTRIKLMSQSDMNEMRLEELRKDYGKAVIAGNIMLQASIATRIHAILLAENNSFDIFEDRVISLLQRWRQYADKHPNLDQSIIVRACCNEIADGFTEMLKGS